MRATDRVRGNIVCAEENVRVILTVKATTREDGSVAYYVPISRAWPCRPQYEVDTSAAWVLIRIIVGPFAYFEIHD